VTINVTADITTPLPPTIEAEHNLATGLVDVVGTGEPRATITLTFPNGEIVTTQVDDNGVYSASSTTVQPDGDVIANQTDPAGNVSGTADDDYQNLEIIFVDMVAEEAVIEQASELAERDTSVSEAVLRHTLDIEGIDGDFINLQRYFETRRLESQDILNRNVEDAAFLGAVSVSSVGRSGDSADFLIVETIAFENHIAVQLTSTFDFVDGVNVKNWQVGAMNGEKLPAWVEHDGGQDFAVIQRPLDQEIVQLKVRALLDNGLTATTSVEINLTTGAMTKLGDSLVQSQTLSEQLALEMQAMERSGEDMRLALA